MKSRRKTFRLLPFPRHPFEADIFPGEAAASADPDAARGNLTSSLHDLVVGTNRVVPVLDGTRPYVDFDNAASTPPFQRVVQKVNDFLPWYSNVHRGAGFTSRLSSQAFEEARRRIGRFVNADPDRQVVLFSRNTTESINHLARRFPFRPGGVVVTTLMEHHSNLLPWRKAARVVYVDVTEDGRVDEADFRRKLAAHRGDVQLVAVSGASNVTGWISPIHRYARWAHQAGAEILVDAAQLAPHRPIDMNPADPAERLDYVAFSAHKMYAPFGVGALVAKRGVFEEGEPYLAGGGTADRVTLEETEWAPLPDKEEAGTPAIVGVIALGIAVQCLNDIGWNRIFQHETDLVRYALRRLSAIPKVKLFGITDPKRDHERLGVISFCVDGLAHGLVSAILSYEWGIGTRSGSFCAHPYVARLLGHDGAGGAGPPGPDASSNCAELDGMIRASFGLYNTPEEVDRLYEALSAVAAGRYRDDYRYDRRHGAFLRDDVDERFDSYFTL